MRGDLSLVDVCPGDPVTRQVLVSISLALSSQVPAVAHGQCISATRCLCRGATTILDGQVVSFAGARTTLQLSAVTGAGEGFTQGQRLTVPREAVDDFPGRRDLIFVTRGDITGRIRVETDGQVICHEASPELSLSVAEAMGLALDANCDQALHAHEHSRSRPATTHVLVAV